MGSTQTGNGKGREVMNRRRVQELAVNVLPVSIVFSIVELAYSDGRSAAYWCGLAIIELLTYCIVVYPYALRKGRDIADKANRERGGKK
jgi:hypothetical protein